MAVNSTTSFSGPYTANGVTTVFEFDFNAMSDDEVQVTRDGAVVDPSLYTVTRGDDGAGSITFLTAPAASEIFVISNPDFKETIAFDRFGPYFPDLINAPLYRAAARSVYLAGVAHRAVLVPKGEAGFELPNSMSADALVALANNVGDINLVADNIGAVVLVAADLTNINTVAGDHANIGVVAGDHANIGVVAGDHTNIGIVAGDHTNIVAVAGAVTNINTVATDIALGAGSSYILRAPQAAIDAAAARDTAIATAAAVGTSVAREADEYNALANLTVMSGWTKVEFRQSSSLQNAPGSAGEIWTARDAGTDWAVGEVIDALVAPLSINSSATQIVVKVWKVATTDGSVNFGPPQTNDVLVSTMTFPIATIEPFDGSSTYGLTVNTIERMMVYPLQAPIIGETGKTYKISFNALDVSNAAVSLGIGTRTISNPSRQRYNGGQRSTPGAGSFTNTSTSLLRSIGALTRVLRSSAAIQTATDLNTAALSAASQTRVARQNVENDNMLYAHAGVLAKVLPDAVTDIGDSLIANANGGATGGAGSYNATGAMSPFITATLNNLGVGGTRTDEILASFLALSSGQKNDYGIANGGTNDISQKASGVVSATITAAGSGGTNGTYTVPTTGGTPPAGKTVTQASYSVTVSGGAITAATPISIGAAFAAAPTFDLSGIPGLTGATLTPVLDIYTTIVTNMAAIMTAGGANRLIMTPWVSGGSATTAWGLARKVAAWEKTTYGARAFDALPYLVRWQANTDPGISGPRAGGLPPYLTTDTLHPSDNGIGIVARERSRMIRALGGIGAPYIHDEIVGVKAGDAVGTPIITPRVLGTPKGMQIVDGNPGDVLHLNGASITASISATTMTVTQVGAGTIELGAVVYGAAAGTVVSAQLTGTTGGTGTYTVSVSQTLASGSLTTGGGMTRGAGTPPSITEALIQSDSLGLGRSNLARIVAVRQMDGTSPQSAVRIRGLSSSNIYAPTTPALIGGGLTKKMTIVLIGRMNSPTTGGIWAQKTASSGDLALFAKGAQTLTFSPRTNGSTLIGSVTTPRVVDSTDWNLWAFTLDSTTGAQLLKGAANEETATTATPTADLQLDLSLTSYLFASAGAPLVNFDIKMLWMAADYIDVTDPTKRALFYDPVTRLPLDLGGAGTVSGITPIIYMRGMAGDYLLGKNYGTGGDFFVPPYINADNVGFMDLTS